MADLSKIIDELSKLTVVEAAELSKQLEEKWGVTAAAPAAAAPAAGGAAPAEEKSDYSIFLSSAGDKKINVIKLDNKPSKYSGRFLLLRMFCNEKDNFFFGFSSLTSFLSS